MSEIRDIISGAGLRARKRLGQHFLTDQTAVTRILEAAQLSRDDVVVEIGPGPGVLTPGLCERAGRVIAVELDEGLIPALRTATAGYDNLEIRQGNVLDLDLAGLPRPYKVVANLPYYVTSPVIRMFLESPAPPRDLTVTIQKEVAERIVAKPPRLSVLAVSVQLYGSPVIVEVVPRTAFWPVPEVDSAVLRVSGVRERTAALLDGLAETDFFTIVRAGFAEKRKQLHNTLARRLDLSHDDATAALTAAGIDPTRRAETLTLAEWMAVTKACRDGR